MERCLVERRRPDAEKLLCLLDLLGALQVSLGGIGAVTRQLDVRQSHEDHRHAGGRWQADLRLILFDVRQGNAIADRPLRHSGRGRPAEMQGPGKNNPRRCCTGRGSIARRIFPSRRIASPPGHIRPCAASAAPTHCRLLARMKSWGLWPIWVILVHT